MPWLKPFALVFHSHPIHGHAQRSLSVFSPSLSTSCSTSSSSLSWWPTVTPWQSTTCATPQKGPSSPWTITSHSQVMSPTPWSSPKPRHGAQRRGLQRIHRLPGFPRPHSPFVRPLHGWRHARQATRRSTPRLRRLPPCGRCKCQSVVSVSHGR